MPRYAQRLESQDPTEIHCSGFLASRITGGQFSVVTLWEFVTVLFAIENGPVEIVDLPIKNG